MRQLTVQLKHNRLDDDRIYPRADIDGVVWLGVFIGADVRTTDDVTRLRSDLRSEDFSYWGQATRAISASGGEVRVYEPGAINYTVMPRWLLSAVLDEWEQFLNSHIERTVSWDYAPTVLDITDAAGAVIGSFKSESSYYHEGDWDRDGYIDTGVKHHWTSNSPKHESILGSHYALAYTEDQRWIVVDDRRRLGGEVRRRQISGPEAKAWLDRNKVLYTASNYTFD